MLGGTRKAAATCRGAPLPLLEWKTLHIPHSSHPARFPQPAPCVSYSGAASGVDVHVVWTGRDAEHGVDLVGTVPASLATYVALQAWPETDLVISAGTAGGFKAKVGGGVRVRISGGALPMRWEPTGGGCGGG